MGWLEATLLHGCRHLHITRASKVAHQICVVAYDVAKAEVGTPPGGGQAKQDKSYNQTESCNLHGTTTYLVTC